MKQRVTPFLVGHVHDLAADVLSRPAIPADLTISRFFAGRKYLGSHDRGYIAETTYGLLRDIITLEWLLEPMTGSLRRAERVELLVAAHMLRTGVEWAVITSSLQIPIEDLQHVSEVLKERSLEADALTGAEAASVRFGVPFWFAEALLDQYGAEAEPLLEALGRQAPVVLRTNSLVTDRARLIQALDQLEIEATPGELSPDAVVLRRRTNAFTIPEFKRGWFEIQDEGSQLLSIALDPHPNWRVFDACAGAGGKSLHLAAIMRGRGEVVAHDVNDRRLSELRPRLRRSTAQNIRVLHHSEYLERHEKLRGEYHAVLIDAPCSGTGVLRRNPGARMTLDEAVLDRLVPLQAEILDEYSTLVEPGGLLLYATCSLLRQENEDQVAGFMSRNPGWTLVPMPLPDSVVTTEGYLRALPHRVGTDGFFGAMFRRHREDA